MTTTTTASSIYNNTHPERALTVQLSPAHMACIAAGLDDCTECPTIGTVRNMARRAESAGLRWSDEDTARAVNDIRVALMADSGITGPQFVEIRTMTPASGLLGAWNEDGTRNTAAETRMAEVIVSVLRPDR